MYFIMLSFFRTLLHQTVDLQNIEMIKLLLDYNASVTAKDIHGK